MSRSFTLPPAIIDYLASVNPPEHPALTACREATAAHPMARMQISVEQGAFLHFMLRLIDARIAVEVGVFTGYSALVTALALRANAGPGAHLVALDVSREFTDLARPHWKAAGVETAIDLRIAPASDSLAALAGEGYTGRVDFMFVDADKTGYLDYLEAGIGLLRPGGLMVFDNVLWSGRVADRSVDDPDTNALRMVAKAAQGDPRVEATMIGVGDGLLLVMKR
jgi:O-methyltransferase